MKRINKIKKAVITVIFSIYAIVACAGVTKAATYNPETHATEETTVAATTDSVYTGEGKVPAQGPSILGKGNVTTEWACPLTTSLTKDNYCLTHNRHAEMKVHPVYGLENWAVGTDEIKGNITKEEFEKHYQSKYVNCPIDRNPHHLYLDWKGTVSTYYYSQSRTPSIEEAYVVTWMNNGTYFYKEEQVGVWGVLGQLTAGDLGGYSNVPKGRGIAVQAGAYAEFYKEDKEVEDLTDYDKVVVEVDQTTGKYIIGPFKIKYADGRIKAWQDKITNKGSLWCKENTSESEWIEMTFGGITDMWLVGDNGTEYEVKEFRTKDAQESYKAQYFTPRSNEQDQYVQTGDCIKTQKYPLPYESELATDADAVELYGSTETEFYILMEKPTDSQVLDYHLKIEYKWMKVNQGSYNYYKGWYYQIQGELHCPLNSVCGDAVYSAAPCEKCKYWDEESRTWIYPVHCTTHHGGPDHEHYIQQTTDVQDFGEYKCGRDIEEIIYESDKKINITFELGGFVWEEILADIKDASVDGTKNGQDILKRGVEVTLRYAEDGVLPGQTKDSVVVVKGVTQRLVTDDVTRVTDTSHLSYKGKGYDLLEGQYLFKGLDAQCKYYVEFKYNGQVYQHTKYTDSSGGIISNSNSEAAEVSTSDTIKSYATETQERGNSSGDIKIIGRDELNELFAEIGSDPESYANGRVFAWKDAWNSEIKASQIQEKDWLKYLYEGEDGEGASPKGEFVQAAIDEYEFNDSAFEALRDYEIITYIKDCIINATTGNNSGTTYASQSYPQVDKFVIWRDSQEDDAKLYSYKGGRDEEIEEVFKQNGDSIYIYDGTINDLRHIDFGITKREEADLALRKDVYEATITIKGNTQTYKYNKRQAISADGTWDIKDKLSTGYYDANYTREIYKEDFSYKSDFYKVGHFYDENGNLADDEAKAALALAEGSQDSELEVYVKYKIAIKNQSATIDAEITELVDYYDEDFEFIEYRPDVSNGGGSILESYIGDAQGNVKGNIGYENGSIYGSGTQSYAGGYNNIYIQIPGGNELQASETMYVYLTFKVKKNSQRFVLLDEAVDQIAGTADTVGKENIVEINGFKTNYGASAKAPNAVEYNAGDTAGLVDIDSVPGNVPTNKIRKEGDTREIAEYFEDDTDKAPNIRIILNSENEREISGTVWEDARTETKENSAQTGNGIRENGEKAVNGVVVQLVEYFTVGNKQYEYIWREMLSGDDRTFYPVVGIEGVDSLNKTYSISGSGDTTGKYKFASFIPGNYFIRFIYGDGTSTVLGLESTDYKTGETISNPVLEVLEVLKNYSYTEERESGKNLGSYKENNDEVTIIQENGTYKFKYEYNEGYIDYLNGSNVGSRSVESKIPLNKDSYNGQDFKSTLYQSGLNTYEENKNESKTYEYKFATVDSSSTNYSDAKDIWSRREKVISYSDENVTNGKAEILSSFERLTTDLEGKTNEEKARAILENLQNKFMKNTYMVAESGTMNIEIEYDRDYSGTKPEGKENIDTSNRTGTIQRDENGNIIKEDSSGQYTNDVGGYYKVESVDLGLQERAKSQIKTNKEVANVRVILADGTTLFDAVEKATNVMWIKGSAHGQDTANTYETTDNYENNMMKIPYVRGWAKNSGANDGYIQLTMDKELMHGATIKITYLITVANIGEVDYTGPTFYYTGNKGSGNIVTTNANQLIDYVGYQGTSDPNAKNNVTRNNQTFIQSENNDWRVIEVAEIEAQNLVNDTMLKDDKIGQYNTVVTTTAVAGELVPIIADETGAEDSREAIEDSPLKAVETINSSNSIRGVYLTLSQTLRTDGSGDDKSYNNMVELVKSSNTVGRRMNYSVVGNQNPIEDPAEIDSDDAEQITILPPFGNTHIYYYLIGTVAVILVAGIILIKVFVLNKRK